MDLNNIIKAALATDKILTPQLNEWLMVHGDSPVPHDIAARLMKEMTTTPRVRSSSFSSSSAGQCHRKQVLAYLGMQEGGGIDPRLQNIFNDGKWRHLRWQTMLLQMGALDDIEVPLFWTRMRSRGTMDGQGTVPENHPKQHWRGKEFGFELKGVGAYIFPKVMKDEKIKEEHTRQVNRYFLMSGLELFVVLYENKGTNEWYEWVVEPDDKIMEEQRKELEVLNDSVDQKVLPPMLPQCKAHMGPTWNECPFGGSIGATCPRAGTWPNIRRKKKNP